MIWFWSVTDALFVTHEWHLVCLIEEEREKLYEALESVTDANLEGEGEEEEEEKLKVTSIKKTSKFHLQRTQFLWVNWSNHQSNHIHFSHGYDYNIGCCIFFFSSYACAKFILCITLLIPLKCWVQVDPTACNLVKHLLFSLFFFLFVFSLFSLSFRASLRLVHDTRFYLVFFFVFSLVFFKC